MPQRDASGAIVDGTGTSAAKGTMQVEIIETPEAFQRLEGPWAQLLARTAGANPYSSFEWMLSWLQTLGERVRLLVIVVHREGRILAIAPLCVQPNGVLTFIGYPQNDYATLLIDPDAPQALDEIVDAIGARRTQWRRMLLSEFHADNPQPAALARAFQARGWPFRLEQGDACPAMTLDDLPAAKKMYQKKNLNTYVNWFKRQGDFAFVVHEQTDAAVARLDDLFAQHVDRWTGTATPSAFLRSEVCAFYRAFVQRLHPRGWARVASLSMGQEFLAFSVFFEYGGVMYLYRPSYNARYAKRSPGQVILRYLFDYAVEHGLREMDFARGDEGYKGRFANLTRHSQRLTLYRNRPECLAASAYDAFRRSRLIDLLYRNALVRKLRYRLLQTYHSRGARPREQEAE